MSEITSSEKNSSLRILVECAIMVAAAFVLSFVKLFDAPFGGSVTLASAAPIILISYRRGIKWGLATGFVYAVLQLVVGLDQVSYIPDIGGIVLCILLDYIVPFTLLGLGGMFAKSAFSENNNRNIALTAGTGAAVVMFIRFVSSTVSGAVVWYSVSRNLGWYTDDATHIINRFGMWTYSIIYNAGYLIPELLITVAVVSVLAVSLKNVKK